MLSHTRVLRRERCADCRRRLSRPWRCRAASPSAARSSPKFFQAATQADFLKGDVENLSIDSHGQLTLGPATELVYETAAPFLWSMVAAAGRLAVRRHRQRRQGVPGRSAGQGLACSSTRRARSARARARAERRAVRRHVARRQDLQGRSQRRRHARSSIPTTSTSGRWPSTRRATCSPAPATRASSTRSRPTAKATPFYKTKATHATALAFDKRRQPARRHRIARPGAAGRSPRARRSCCSIRRSRRSARCASTTRALLYVAAVSGRAGPAAAPHRRRRSQPPIGRHPSRRARRCRRCRRKSPRSRSSTSAAAPDRPRSTREDRRSPKGAVYRIAPDGVWDQLWESRDDSPYDLTFDQNGALDRRHRQQGQDLPARGRSAAADAARARQRAAGHGVLQGRARPAVLRDRQPGKAVPALAPIARRAAPTSRKRATRRWWRRGAPSAGAARRRPAAASSCSRDRATPRRPTTPGAPGRPPTRTPRARRSRARRRAICSGAPC